MNSKHVSYIGILLLAGILSTTTTNSDAPTRSACTLINNMASQSAALAAKSASIAAKTTQLKDFLGPCRNKPIRKQTRARRDAYTRGTGIGTGIKQSDIAAAAIGFEITISGTYKLEGNIVGNAANSTTVIKVSADNVVLDLCGFTITSTSAAFNARTIEVVASRVIIRNGAIGASNFVRAAFEARSSTSVWIADVTVITGKISVDSFSSGFLATNSSSIDLGFLDAGFFFTGSNIILDTCVAISSTSDGVSTDDNSVVILNSSLEGTIFNGILVSAVLSTGVLVRNSTIKNSGIGFDTTGGGNRMVFLSNTIQNCSTGIDDAFFGFTDRNFFGNNNVSGSSVINYVITAPAYFSDRPPTSPCPLVDANYWCNCEP